MNGLRSPKKLPVYSTEEFVEKGDGYFTAEEGLRLFLYKHPISGLYFGVCDHELDDLRNDFANYLKNYLLENVDLKSARPERIQTVSKCLFSLLRSSPPPHPWLSLPADSRVNLNSSTMASHALLVSAFSCAMTKAWIMMGKSIGDLLRFQVPLKQMEIPVSEEELISFVRVASLCHDFGKHPPQKHHERGREQVRDIFNGILDDTVVFSLSEVAYRHHTSLHYRLRDESPIGYLEELIAHADTLASAVDRPVSEQMGDPVSSVTRFLREALGNEKALSLISADTDQVKRYVFETVKLPEVRGASVLLSDLNEIGIAELLWEDYQLPPECLLYSAGGSALIVAPTEVAEDLARSIQRLYLGRTKVATISVVHRPTLPMEWVRGVEAGGDTSAKFGSLVRWLGYDLRRAKESRAFYPFFETTAYCKPCDSCETRPAEQIAIEPDGREVFLCGICRQKRDLGCEQKSAYLRRFEDFLNTEEGRETPYSKHFVELALNVPSARDLHEISEGAEGKAKGYVGIIYTDGNDIGSRLEESQTPAEFRTLSEELRRVTMQATFKALAKRSLLKEVKCSDGQVRWIHPLEIVAIGGDDVFLIVPADVALDVALDLCEIFQNEFNGNLTMSAGVLIMRDHLPIYYARSIVEALLKSAKKAGRKARQKHEPIPAYIDFQVITGDSSLSEDLEGYRQQVYSLSSMFKGDHHLVQRPYDLKNLRELLGAVRWAREKGFPPSQLYLLRQAVVEHVPAWAKNWFQYQLARDEKEQDNGFRQFHRVLFGTGWRKDSEAPWCRFGREWRTPVVDLVEIFDYVRIEQKGQ